VCVCVCVCVCVLYLVMHSCNLFSEIFGYNITLHKSIMCLDYYSYAISVF